MMMRRAGRLAWIMVLAALMFFGAIGRTDAAFTVTFAQVGNDVVATGTGSLDLTGVIDGGLTSIYGGSIRPAAGSLRIGEADFERAYRPFFANTAGFGADVSRGADSGTGYHVGFLAGVGLYLSDVYVSKTQFTSRSTFNATTLAGLGLTAGTYTYAYSATQGGPTLDTFTIQVGPALGSVPEPASGLMCAIAGVIGLAWRSTRRRGA